MRKAVWLVGLWLGLCSLALAAPVAMVTDVRGTVSLASGEAVDLLASLEAGTRLRLGADGHLVVVYLADSVEYRVDGPAALVVGRDEATVDGGQLSSLALNASLPTGALHTGSKALAQAALVLRDVGQRDRIVLLGPRNSRVFARGLRLRWQPVAGVSEYVLRLSNAYGETLLERKVRGRSWTLPSSLDLVPGEEYGWQLSARAEDGRLWRSARARFELASAEDERSLSVFKQHLSEGVGQQVLYAALLEQRGFVEAARAQWALIAQQRPDSAAARAKLGD